MTGLQRDFTEAIDALDLPSTDLVTAVLGRIDEGLPSRSASSWNPWNRPLAFAFAVVSVLGLVLTLVLQQPRSVVADWLGIGATGIEPLPDSPGVQVPTTALDASANELGEPVLGVVLDPIPALGEPSEILDSDLDSDRGRSFGWAANEQFPELGDSGFGVVLSVRPLESRQNWKAVGADLDVEFVDLMFGGAPTIGLWIPGSHQLLLADGSRPLSAERVLLWEAPGSGVEYRLETRASKATVISLVSDMDATLE